MSAARVSAAAHRQDRRYTKILVALSPLDDGTGTLGTIVRTALADDPAATVEDVRSIVEQAIAEAAAEDAIAREDDAS